MPADPRTPAPATASGPSAGRPMAPAPSVPTTAAATVPPWAAAHDDDPDGHRSLSLAAGTRRGPRGSARTGIVWASVWLVYLVPGLVELVRGEHGETARWAGPPTLAVFVGLYVWLMLRAWRPPDARPGVAVRAAEGWGRPDDAPDRLAVWLLLAATALAVAATSAFGDGVASTLVFLAPAAASVFSGRRAAAGIVAAALLAGAYGMRGGDVSTGAFAAFPTLMAGLIVLGVKHMRAVIDELDATREEVRRLAASEERSRLGRDLHDLLGHGLTVISVKSQLAGRLLERGEHERAAAEIAELEDVARTALAEVREVVTEYRMRPLATELAAARATLEGAGLHAAVEPACSSVPPAAEPALGFVVREGVTNVLRHGRATACRISAGAAPGGGFVLEVRDDGVGPGPGVALREIAPGSPEHRGGAGNGLAGLAERLAEVGGRLEAGPGPDGGHLLRAHVPQAAGDGLSPADVAAAPAREPAPSRGVR